MTLLSKRQTGDVTADVMAPVVGGCGCGICNMNDEIMMALCEIKIKRDQGGIGAVQRVRVLCEEAKTTSMTRNKLWNVLL